MARGAVLGIAIVGLLMCSGCGVAHYDVPTDTAGQPTVTTIVARLECEIRDMVRDDMGDDDVTSFHRLFLLNGDYDIAVALQLEVNDSGGLTPTLAYLNPISKLASFMFGGSATLSESRDQTFTENIQLSTRKIYSDWKNKTKSFDCPTADTNLAGTLGIKDLVAMAALTDRSLGPQPAQSQAAATPPQQCAAAPKSPPAARCPGVQQCLCPPAPQQTTSGQQGSTTQFGGSIQFLVTKNLTAVGPTWSLVHFKGPGGLAGVSEVNTDKITLAFAQGPNVGKPLAAVGNAPNLDAYKLLQQILTSSINSQLLMLQNLR